ncbi:hypothetical protein S40293_09493 [Stachybotrys chartarum IBT 40293]|nr:hypothetical protein S40293_09493 [Stachybotrys chartarum IBT 40293]
MTALSSNAPRLTPEKREKVCALLPDNILIKDIAQAIPGIERSVRRIRVTVKRYGTKTALLNCTGPNPKITLLMREVPYKRLNERPHMRRGDMLAFFSKTYQVDMSPANIARALKSSKWIDKKACRIAR